MTPDLLPAVSDFSRLVLWMLILWSAAQLGAALYEARVVIPLWSVDPAPETLGKKIADSGHTASATRIWPYLSPVVFLLAIVNLVVAWRHDGPARPWWLAASAGYLAMSLATYGYFVPTMISLMNRAHAYTPEKLSRTVATWSRLSNLRLLIAVPACLAAVKALTLLGGRTGWRL